MYQVAFSPEEFARFVPWLMLNRGGLDVLVHPQTGDAYADHTEHAQLARRTAAAAPRCVAPRSAGLNRRGQNTPSSNRMIRMTRMTPTPPLG